MSDQEQLDPNAASAQTSGSAPPHHTPSPDGPLQVAQDSREPSPPADQVAKSFQRAHQPTTPERLESRLPALDAAGLRDPYEPLCTTSNLSGTAPMATDASLKQGDGLVRTEPPTPDVALAKAVLLPADAAVLAAGTLLAETAAKGASPGVYYTYKFVKSYLTYQALVDHSQ